MSWIGTKLSVTHGKKDFFRDYGKNIKMSK